MRHSKIPLNFLLLMVTRMGRDYRPGPRQRMEQVALGAAHADMIMPRYTRLLHGWPFAGSGRREIGSLNGQAFSLAKEFAIVIE